MKPRIAEIRKNKGLQQGFVAKKVGVSQQLMSDWEKGKAFPRVDRAYRLADVLGCDVNELYEKEE